MLVIEVVIARVFAVWRPKAQQKKALARFRGYTHGSVPGLGRRRTAWLCQIELFRSVDGRLSVLHPELTVDVLGVGVKGI